MSEAKSVGYWSVNEDQLLLRVDEAAARLGVSRATLNRLLREGSLRSVKIGSARRVPVADLAAFVERLRRNASAGAEAIQ